MMVHTEKRISMPSTRELEEAFQTLKRRDSWQRAGRTIGSACLLVLLCAILMLVCGLIGLL